MRHAKIDAILELIDGALAAYTVEGHQPASTGPAARRDTRAGHHRPGQDHRR